MYEGYWQLARKPFEPTSDTRDYYPSESHQGALLKLRYAIENRRGAALVVGPAGTGKTMLVGALRRNLPEGFRPFVHLVFPQLGPAELLRYLADELSPVSAGVRSEALDHTVRRIRDFLIANTQDKQHAVVAVDEADLLTTDGSLEALRLLLNFEIAGRPGMTLLLAGQPTILPALARNPTLDERFGVKTLLRPFHVEETVSYINHRLKAAGAKRAIFEPAALEAVHHLTYGVPRQINRLCDLALLIGFAEELSTLSAAHVESVCGEMVNVSCD